MTVIVCTDERGGMLFMKRRVSKDRELIADILKTVGDGILYISDFSEAAYPPCFTEVPIWIRSLPSARARPSSTVYLRS